MAERNVNGGNGGRRRMLRGAQRAAGFTESVVRLAATPLRTTGFPLRAPTVPGGVEVPEEPPSLGADYDTDWARQPVARAVRGVLVEGPLRLATAALARPEILGHDRLADLTRLESPPPVIFAPNHHSHVDTGLMIRAVPAAWRHDLVVAAAADYFFDSRWKATMSALALNAIPIDREVTGRRSADLVRDLIAEGNSLVIYPEGGRSPDGWGQSFKGGAAYLSIRTAAPVIPVFIDGTGSIFGKGMTRPRPGRTRVVFGRPIVPSSDETTRRLNARISAAVAELGDEALSDAWAARRRAARGETPSLEGPDHTGWRRDWALTEHRRHGAAGRRRRPERSWPDLG